MKETISYILVAPSGREIMAFETLERARAYAVPKMQNVPMYRKVKRRRIIEEMIDID